MCIYINFNETISVFPPFLDDVMMTMKILYYDDGILISIISFTYFLRAWKLNITIIENTQYYRLVATYLAH